MRIYVVVQVSDWALTMNARSGIIDIRMNCVVDNTKGDVSNLHSREEADAPIVWSCINRRATNVGYFLPQLICRNCRHIIVR